MNTSTEICSRSCSEPSEILEVPKGFKYHASTGVVLLDDLCGVGLRRLDKYVRIYQPFLHSEPDPEVYVILSKEPGCPVTVKVLDRPSSGLGGFACDMAVHRLLPCAEDGSLEPEVQEVVEVNKMACFTRRLELVENG